jgi:hypothetical protein
LSGYFVRTTVTAGHVHFEKVRRNAWLSTTKLIPSPKKPETWFPTAPQTVFARPPVRRSAPSDTVTLMILGWAGLIVQLPVGPDIFRQNVWGDGAQTSDRRAADPMLALEGSRADDSSVGIAVTPL